MPACMATSTVAGSTLASKGALIAASWSYYANMLLIAVNIFLQMKQGPLLDDGPAKIHQMFL